MIDFQSSEIKIDYSDITVTFLNTQSKEKKQIKPDGNYKFRVELEAGVYEIEATFSQTKDFLFFKRAKVNLDRNETKSVYLTPFFLGRDEEFKSRMKSMQVEELDFPSILFPEKKCSLVIWHFGKIQTEDYFICKNAHVSIDSLNFFSPELFIQIKDPSKMKFYGELFISKGEESTRYYYLDVSYGEKINFYFDGKGSNP